MNLTGTVAVAVIKVRLFGGRGVATGKRRVQRMPGQDGALDTGRQLADAGWLEQTEPMPVLSRAGLLRVDSLLPAFFDPDEQASTAADASPALDSPVGRS